MVRLTDRPDMTLDVYRGRKTTIQQQQLPRLSVVRLTDRSDMTLAVHRGRKTAQQQQQRDVLRPVNYFLSQNVNKRK